MSFWSSGRHANEIERIATAERPGAARDAIEAVLARRRGASGVKDSPGPPLDARAASLLARARSEAGDIEGALAAAEEARAGLLPAAGHVLRAEILLDGGRRAEARTALGNALRAEPDNLAARGLLAVTELEESGARDARRAIEALPRGAVWSDPVLARLVLVLEMALDARCAGGPPPEGLHRARAALFRPHVEDGPAPPFWLDRLEALMARVTGRGGALRRIQADVERAWREGDLGRAADAARAGARSAAPGMPREDLEDLRVLAMEFAFHLERFRDVATMHREWFENGDSLDPHEAALGAYAMAADGKPERALLVLERFSGSGTPELLHLAALVDLKLGKPFRAAGWLRRAVAAGDIAMVDLAREEAALL